MPFGWKGNRRSGITDCSTSIHLLARWHKEGREAFRPHVKYDTVVYLYMYTFIYLYTFTSRVIDDDYIQLVPFFSDPAFFWRSKFIAGANIIAVGRTLPAP